MKKYSIIILILCSWAMSLFAISCSDQESKPQPFLEIKKDTVVFAQEAANTSIVVNTNIAWPVCLHPGIGVRFREQMICCLFR